MPAVAREFGITQPAISSALSRISKRGLGVDAVRPLGRAGSSPTAAAEIIALLLQARARGTAPHRSGHRGQPGDAARPASSSAHCRWSARKILPLAIASLLARYPKLHVATVESPYDALAASLRSGDIDFILGALRSASAAELEQEPLSRTDLRDCARRPRPRALSQIDFDALRQATWVLSRQGSPSRDS